MTSKKPIVKLRGQDSNVFNLIGLCNSALRRAGHPEQVKEFTAKCFAAGSYDEALRIMMTYCDVK